MFCAKCGARLPDDAQFCNNCGNKIAAVQPSVYTQPQPVVQQPAAVVEKVRPQPPSYSGLLLVFGILSLIGVFISLIAIPNALEATTLDEDALGMSPELFVLLSMTSVVVGFLQGLGCIIQKKWSLRIARDAAIVSIVLSIKSFFLNNVDAKSVFSVIIGIAISIVIISFICQQIDKIKSYEYELYQNEHADEINAAEEKENERLKEIRKASSETEHLDVKEGYTPAEADDKYFVIKTGEPDIYYCPNCYRKTSKGNSSCNECNRNFHKKFF